MAILLSCLLAQAWLAHAIASPWWVPDLTVVGLMVAVTRTPHRWLPLSLVAGAATMVWMIRFAAPLLLGYVTFGWVLQVLITHWEISDWRLRSTLAALVSLLLTLTALWLDETWSLTLLALLLARAFLTALAVPVVQRLVRPAP